MDVDKVEDVQDTSLTQRGGVTIVNTTPGVLTTTESITTTTTTPTPGGGTTTDTHTNTNTNTTNTNTNTNATNTPNDIAQTDQMDEDKENDMNSMKIFIYK